MRDGAAFLELALPTILRQTHANLEIVISDNASSDGTEEICRRFARDDSRIRYVRQPTLIPADENFRFVFQQCDSPWFMWASHDDLRDENYVEVLLSGFASYPEAALVVTHTEIFSDHRFPTRADRCEPPMQSTIGLPFPERHKTVVANGAVQIYGLFRSDVIRSYRWPKVPVGHDWMTLHWAATVGEIVYVPGSTFRYFIPPVVKSTTDANAYHWLKKRSWLDSVRSPPDVRWAFHASREIASERRAQGVDVHRWALFPAFCFLHHGGPKAWAKTFLYKNAPAPLRDAWRGLRRPPA